MTLEHLALVCLGVGVANLTAGVFIRLFEDRYDDDDDDVEDDYVDRLSEGEHESTDFFGYIVTSLGILLYIAYIILQG